MNFKDFLDKELRRKAANGQTATQDFSLENVKFTNVCCVESARILSIDFYEKQNRLDFTFYLLHKGYQLAYIELELFSPSQFRFLAGKSVKNLQDINLADEPYKTASKFELTSTHLILQKNDDLDFELGTEYKTLNIEIEFINQTSFIERLDKKEKHNNLFHRICKIISDEELIDIANRDYGCEADLAFKELKHIRDTESTPKNTPFVVNEVLSLTRYSSPDAQRVFTSTIILLGDFNAIQFENEEVDLVTLFVSSVGLGLEFFEDARAFFMNLLPKTCSMDKLQLISYLILGWDLLLKDEDAVREKFNFLNQTEFLQTIDFKYQTSHTAKTVKDATLILLKNSGAIKDKTLKKGVSELFTSMVRICEERFDINAINALFKRNFKKKQREEYIELLPEIGAVKYRDRHSFLVEKGLSDMQAQIITRSIFNAEQFIDGSDYEVELNRNVFFEAWAKLYMKTKR